MSPKKISDYHKIYVTPLDKKDTVPESPSSVTYLFKSPSKELQKINSIVANGTASSQSQVTITRSDIKRTLPFDEPALPVAKVIRVETSTSSRITSIDRRLNSLITERQDNRDDDSRK